MAKQTKQAQQPTTNRVPSGYEGGNVPTDFHIPAVGIEDADVALFNLFNRDLQSHAVISDEEGHFMTQRKVPVVFATGERFALRQRNNPIRDKSGALILPIISVRRTGIDTSFKGHNNYGIAQTTGDLIIKKRLSERDPQFQNLINKIGLKEQDNVATVANLLNQTTSKGAQPGKVASRRDKVDTVRDDQLLKPNLNTNIFEIITMPFPTFFTATYEVVIWTSYTQHMNQILERIMTNHDYQKNSYRLTTDKGYWFVAYLEDSLANEDNLEEFTDETRVNKMMLTFNVPAFMIANQNGGDMVPFRRYLSAPQFSFGFIDGIFEKPLNTPEPEGDPDAFILDDIEPLDITGKPVNERETDLFQRQVIRDPFSGKDEEVFVRIKQRDARAGETTISSRRLFDVEIP